MCYYIYIKDENNPLSLAITLPMQSHCHREACTHYVHRVLFKLHLKQQTMITYNILREPPILHPIIKKQLGYLLYSGLFCA